MHGFPSPQVGLAWPSHVTCTLGGGLPQPGLAPRPASGGQLCASLLGLVQWGHTPCPRPSQHDSLGKGPLCGKNCFDKTELRVLPRGRSC